MKAIIIAAGLGSRLNQLTADTPKCMLPVGNKPIVEYLFDAFTSNNIKDIAIVKGYLKDKINYPQYKEYINEDYPNNNIMSSLMYAESFMDDEIVISYSDIIYSPEIVAELLKSQADIAIVVDQNWRQKYVGRDSHPESEAEKAKYSPSLKAMKLGKVIPGDETNVGEFIGLLKLSPRGCKIFKEEFIKAKKKYEGKPFYNAPTFDKAYITDFLNHIISLDYEVYCTLISGGWREIDTEQDIESARQWINQTHLKRAI